MPHPKSCDARAERATCRKRRHQALADHLDQKGLPSLHAASTIPGPARWEQAMANIEAMMMRIEAEMEAYQDERSDRWHKSEQAYHFQRKIEDLRAALDLVTEWII